MGRLERWFLYVYGIALMAYIPCFLSLAPKFGEVGSRGFWAIVTAHVTLMFMGLLTYVIVLRDLYKRTYMTANQKLTWGLWMLLFSPLIIAYYVKHARYPRERTAGDALNDTEAL